MNPPLMRQLDQLLRHSKFYLVGSWIIPKCQNVELMTSKKYGNFRFAKQMSGLAIANRSQLSLRAYCKSMINTGCITLIVVSVVNKINLDNLSNFKFLTSVFNLLISDWGVLYKTNIKADFHISVYCHPRGREQE